MAITSGKISGVITKHREYKGNFCRIKVEVADAPFGMTNGIGKRIERGVEIHMIGYSLPRVGQRILVEGKFEQSDSRFVPSFKIDDVLEVDGFPNPIPLLKKVKGIGGRTAQKIVDAYGQDCIQRIMDEPYLLDEIGLGKLSVNFRLFFSEDASDEVLEEFNRIGLNNRQIASVIAAYGSDALEIFKANPYRSLSLDGFYWKIVEEIAVNLGFDSNSAERLSAGITYALAHIFNTADTYVPFSRATSNIKRLVGPVDNVRLNNEFKKLISEKIVWVQKDKAGEMQIGLNSLTDKERFIAESVRAMARRYKRNTSFAGPLKQREMRSGYSLADSQKRAVEMALNNGFSIITGGPGTGKTFTVTSVIEVAEAMEPGISIVCLAPTGRAAGRMMEQTRKMASTIHSLLKMKPGDEQSDITITADLVIVDETSMLDVHIAAALFASLSPRTRMVFVGDVDQLPSVGAGSVLRDLIDSGCVPVTKLDVVYRQGDESNIPRNSRKVLADNPELIFADDFRFIEVDETSSQDTLLTEYQRAVRAHGLQETCLLTPLRRKGATATNTLNPVIQELLNPRIKEDEFIEIAGKKVKLEPKPELEVGRKVFRIGDKVMMTVNCELAANGDVGLIVDINPYSRTISVDFGYNEAIQFSKPEDLEALVLAYAMTIHKSQGSEYEVVIISLMDEHEIMLQKNLLYTAITRAKKRVVIVGQRSALQKSISGLQEERKTLLKGFLKRLG